MKREFLGIPVWLLVGIGLLFIYHLFTLTISPMPWFDETYFASMTLNFVEKGEFLPPIGPMLEFFYPQSKAYGPAYFVVMAGVLKVFGFGILQMRIPALLFGFLFILTVYKILTISNIKQSLRIFVVLLLLFDPIFLQNIHSGRMDSMAILLVVLGIYQLLVGFRKNLFIHFAACGFFFGLALLTTPRIAVNLAGPGLIAAFFYLSNPNWKRFFSLLIIPLLVFGLYSIWVFWGFGGYEQAYNYFFGKPKEALYFQSLAAIYVSSRKYIPPFQYPVLFVFGVFLSINVYFRRNTEWIFWISIFNLLSFYALVNDTGIYSIFSMPWIYIGLACIAQSFFSMERIESIMRIALSCVFLLNLSLFFLKNTVIWLYAGSRNISIVQQQISKNLPKGSRVIGDEAYYYFILNSGSDFQYLDRGAATHQRINYHENIYKYQYIIVRNPPMNQFAFDHYTKALAPHEIAKIKMPVPSDFAQSLGRILTKLKIEIPKGYEGTIYKR